MKNLKILYLEDSKADFDLAVALFREAGFKVQLFRVQSEEEFRQGLSAGDWDLILADYHLPTFDGLSALELVQAEIPGTPFILLSGALGEERAIKALQSGASDYVLKQRIGRLIPASRRALEEAAERRRRIQAEKELIASQNRYKLLAENAVDMVWKLNPQFILEYMSPSSKGTLGFSPAEMMDRCICEFLPPGEWDRLHTALPDPEHAGSHDDMFSLEIRFLPVQGDPIPFELKGKILFDKDGNFEGYQGHARDIRERKQTELEYTRLYTAIEQAAEAVTITNGEGRIVYANPATEKLSGIPLEQLTGAFPDYLKMDGDPVSREIRHSLHERKTWSGVVRGSLPDGRRYEHELTISPIRTGDGELSGLVSVARDVTFERELQEQLNQSRKMEAIGTLAGGIAHDFNNILSMIMGYSEMSILETANDSSLQENLREIVRAGTRAKHLIKQILDFSRKSEEGIGPISLRPVINESIRLLRATLPASIAIESDIQGNPHILGDAVRIHQILMNIGTNAYHAMRESGGKLEIRCSAVSYAQIEYSHREGLQHSSYVRITIRDTGTGMQSHVAERIFEPYFTTRATGEGTGLGLSIVHGIVKAHNGSIHVDTQPGEGSVFSIYLPLIHEREIQKPDPVELPEQRTHARILFVDDEPMIVKAYARNLDRLGYRVTGAGSAEEALDLLEKSDEEFDILLTDMTMPGSTGLQLAEKVHRNKKDMPVILCSGYHQILKDIDPREVGIFRILRKPYTLTELVVTLEEAMKNPKKPETG